MPCLIQKKQIFLIHAVLGNFEFIFFLWNQKHFRNGTLLLDREPTSCTFFFSVGVFSLFEGGTLAQKQSHKPTVCEFQNKGAS